MTDGFSYPACESAQLDWSSWLSCNLKAALLIAAESCLATLNGHLCHLISFPNSNWTLTWLWLLANVQMHACQIGRSQHLNNRAHQGGLDSSCPHLRHSAACSYHITWHILDQDARCQGLDEMLSQHLPGQLEVPGHCCLSGGSLASAPRRPLGYCHTTMQSPRACVCCCTTLSWC